MILKIILLVLALFLLTACTGTREGRAAAYDPCDQMREDAEIVDGLESQVRALRDKAYPEPSEHSAPDPSRKLTAESLLVQKENLLTLAVQSMQQSAQDCAARSRPFDRYRTAPEREERL